MMFLLQVDICFITGPGKDTNKEAKAFGQLFSITDKTLDNALHKYVWCKIDLTKQFIKLTQLVKINRFHDKFGYNQIGNKQPSSPAKPGSVLVIESEGGEPAKNKEHARYQNIVGTTNHMAQWTRIDLQNA